MSKVYNISIYTIQRSRHNDERMHAQEQPTKTTTDSNVDNETRELTYLQRNAHTQHTYTCTQQAQ